MTHTTLQPAAFQPAAGRPDYRPRSVPCFASAFPSAGVLSVLAVLLMLALSGCVHRIDIQQGNLLDQEDIDRIAVGMTRVQVRALLGTPMVADPFHEARWDYVYYLKQGRLKKPEYRHFIVRFDAADKVASIEHPDKGRAVSAVGDTTEGPSGDQNVRNDPQEPGRST